MLIQLKSYLPEKVDYFITQLEASRLPNNSVAIHEIRTIHKRFRSLWRLAKYAKTVEIDKTKIESLKSLYRHSGEIRDIEIVSSIIENLELKSMLIEEFLKYLDTKLNEALDRFHHFANSFQVDQIHGFVAYLFDLLRKIIQNDPGFLKDHFKTSMRLCGNIPDYSLKPSILHKFRSRLKDIYYLRELEGHLLSGDDTIQNLQDGLKHQTDIIGRWHDLEVCLLSFQSYIAKLPAIKANSQTESIRIQSMLQALIVTTLKEMHRFQTKQLVPKLQELAN